MSGAETDTNTVREALTKLVPRWPCELCVHDHCACTETSRVALAALSRLSGRVTELEQENALLRPPAGAAPILLIDAQQLQSRVTELERALAFYADEDNYRWDTASNPPRRGRIQAEDKGAHARAALAGSAGQEQA